MNTSKVCIAKLLLVGTVLAVLEKKFFDSDHRYQLPVGLVLATPEGTQPVATGSYALDFLSFYTAKGSACCKRSHSDVVFIMFDL